MHRRSKKILIGVGVVVGVLVGIYGIALTRATLKRRAAYRALEQDGRPMVASEFIPPPVAETENAAPLYLKAVQRLKAQSITRNKDLLEYLAGLAIAFIREECDPEKRAEFDKLMAQENVGSALATVAEALERPACRFDYDYDNGLCVEPFAPRDLRDLARIWAAHACLEAEAGRTSGAWDMVQAQFRLTETLRRAPAMSPQFFRFSMIRDLCYITRRLYEIAPPDEADYQKIETLLANSVDIAPVVHALDAERLLRGEWLFNQPRGQLYEAVKDSTMFLGGDDAPEVFARLVFRIIAFRPRFVADHTVYLQVMRDAVHVVESPFAPPEAKIHQTYEDIPAWAVLAHELTPRIEYVKGFHCRMVAHVHMTRAGLALLRYRDAHGTFPDSLEALNLEGLIDPFVEAPLHYRTEGEGFVIYSVGEDQKDNGGTPRQPLDTSGRRLKRDPEYDLPWRYPRATSPQ